MKNPTYIYHKTESPKVVSADDAHKHYASGWSDTPATFLNTKGEDNGESTDENTDEVPSKSADEKPRKGRSKGMLTK